MSEDQALEMKRMMQKAQNLDDTFMTNIFPPNWTENYEEYKQSLVQDGVDYQKLIDMYLHVHDFILL